MQKSMQKKSIRYLADTSLKKLSLERLNPDNYRDQTPLCQLADRQTGVFFTSFSLSFLLISIPTDRSLATVFFCG